jgi:hypothetical protein
MVIDKVGNSAASVRKELEANGDERTGTQR